MGKMAIAFDRYREAAERLRTALTAGTPCAPILDLIDSTDVAGAYAVQEIGTTRALAEGRQLSGRKIGLTSLAVQKQLGVHEPDFGMLFADMAIMDGDEVSVGRLLQPRVEAEIAFVMGCGVEDAGVSADALAAAVDYVLPALEIVDSRIANWRISLADTIADNASSGLYVLGKSPRALHGLDLRLCGMVMESDGQIVSTGVGAACLGHPLSALAWLAAKMAQVGRPLRAGDIVLSGALGPMVEVVPGHGYHAEVAGLGSVGVRFAG